ncbi:helix-turn-helix domain-containing protein [Vallitalea okinawensis]|uniref:helix-turn-helix domain-containing protein n=1 Tax=Vallitalea okinawensis TaxID=2078660 RepID=UPI000CFE2EF8|nr:helix-turn-helix domain-containing protein [Vallitalea okinawensis]
MNKKIPYIENPSNDIKVKKVRRSNTMYIHQHKYFEMVYFYSGSGTLIINETEYPLQRGHLLFFNIGDAHAVNAEGEIETVNIAIPPDFIDYNLINSQNMLDFLSISAFNEFNIYIDGISPVMQFKGRDLVDLEHLLNSIIDESVDQDKGYKTILQAYIKIIFIIIFRHLSKNNRSHIQNELSTFLPQVISYVEKHYKEPITIKDIAANNFYNPSYLSKIFKECYGESLTNYINNKRINDSLELLKNSTYSIENIATEVGYSDKKQFYRMFKKYMSITPGSYRDK